MRRHFRNYRVLIQVSVNVMVLIFLWINMCDNGHHKPQQRFVPLVSPLNQSQHSDLLNQVNKTQSEVNDTLVTGTKISQNFYSFQNIPIINNYSFSYPINVENACKTFKVEVFMPVHSNIASFKERANTRQSDSGKYTSDKRNRAVQLFFVGLPQKTKYASVIQEKLRKESEKYGDIIQINVDDVYQNISLKAMAVLKWITNYCNNSEFVIKIDDDVIFETSRCAAALRQKQKEVPNFVMSHIRRVGDVRHLDGKYRVKLEDWPPPTYPPYVAGGLIGYPTTTVLLLYQQTLRTKRLWLDDVFITGICTLRLGIPVFASKSFIYTHHGSVN